MKKNLTKLLTILTCVLLLTITIMPTKTFAEDGEVVNEGEETNEVVEVNNEEEETTTLEELPQDEEEGNEEEVVLSEEEEQDEEEELPQQELLEEEEQKQEELQEQEELQQEQQEEELEPVNNEELNANGSETATFDIRGYTSGGDWVLRDAKNIDFTVGNLSLNANYYIQIKVKKGLYISDFMWNDDWGSVPTGILGKKSTMINSYQNYISGNEISFSDNTYVLTYEISKDARSANITGQVKVKPNAHLTYNGDIIENAVSILLLDSNKTTVLATKTYNVKVVRNNVEDGIDFYSNSFRIIPGLDNQQLTQMGIFNYTEGTNKGLFGSLTSQYVIYMPDCVEEVSDVVPVGSEIDPSFTWSWDATNHKVTLNNLKLNATYDVDSNHTMNGVSSGGGIRWNIIGKIKAGTNEGSYRPTKDNEWSMKMYDGQTFTQSDYGTICSTAAGTRISLSVAAEDAGVVQIISTISQSSLRVKNNIPGYPTSLSYIDGPHFRANSNLTQDQIATYEFADNTFDITGVFFPIQAREKLLVTALKVADAEGNVTTLNNLSIEIEKTNGVNYYGSLHNVLYVTVTDLKARSNSIPQNAKYIKSITANCGTFTAGYAAPSGQNPTRIGAPVGYISQSVLDQKKNQNLYYKFVVNGKEQNVKVPYVYGNSTEILASCTPNKTTVISGEDLTIKARIMYYNHTRASTAVSEPDLFVIVPKGLEINPSEVTARWQYGTTANDIEDYPKSRIKYVGPTTVTNEAGEQFECYRFYVENSVLSLFRENTTQYYFRGSSTIEFSLPFTTSSGIQSQVIDLGDYILAGDVVSDGTFSLNDQTILANRTYDIWDLDGDGIRNETTVVKSEANKFVNIMEDKDVTVKGYLTQHDETGAIATYNPGVDGSSDNNAVVFSTGTLADYHVVVSNNIEAATIASKVNAYIPIPQGTINGATYTPKNTGEVTLATGESTRFQFNSYGFPMSLNEKIVNPDPTIFQITYWLNKCGFDDDGLPKAVTGTTKVTEANMAQNDSRLKDVVLVEISSNDVPLGYNTDGAKKFKMVLGINATSDQAINANINSAKNIFRPVFSRKTSGGEVVVNGGYVAAKLSVAKIAGKVFKDNNGNGLYDNGTDVLLNGVEVRLLKHNGSSYQNFQTTTSVNGEYQFDGLANAKYQVRFIKTDGYFGYARRINDTSTNYHINSDATPHNSGFSYFNIELPFSSSIQNAQLYINAGFVDGITVKFENSDANKGTFSPTTDQEIGKGNAPTLPTTTPKNNYEFDGWKNGNTVYTSGTPLTANTTLMAYWKAKSYTISYELNGGAVSGTNPTTYTHETATFTLINPTRSGFTFKGWSGTGLTGSANKTVTITKGSTGNRSYTANFLQNYTITYNLNNGTVSGTNPTTYHKETPAFTLINPTRTGYNFKGWSGTGLTGDTNTSVSISKGSEGNRSYTANWTAITYTITYVLGDGGTNNSANPANYTVAQLPITLKNPTRTGYTFKNWTITGATPAISAGSATIPANTTGNLTATANWLQNYTITYNLNNGTVSGTNPTTYHKETPAFTLINPTRTGYNFKGWSGTGLTGSENKSVTIAVGSEGNRSYTANWTAITYTISYTLNSGTVSGTNPASYTIESNDITLKDASKRGYTFNGWKISGAQGSNAGSVNTSTPKKSPVIKKGTYGNLTCVADFSVINYTITYELDGGTNAGNNPTSYNVTSNITLQNPSKTDYSFLGWTISGANPTTVNKTEPTLLPVIPTGTINNLTVTAHWAGIGRSITYNLDGGQNHSDNPATYPADADLVIKEPTKAHYTFVGWTGTNGSTPSKSVTIPKGSTGGWILNANWEAVDYTISYTLNGGTVSGNPTSYNIETETFELKNPTRAGYTFKGWTGTGLSTATMSVTVTKGATGDRSYTATWQANTYTISYTLNSGSHSGNPTSYNIETANITLKDASRTGYTFNGWKISGAQGPNASQVNTTTPKKSPVILKGTYGNLTCVADFTVINYSITYVLNGGTHSGNPTSYNVDTANITLKDASRNGYTFNGWTIAGATPSSNNVTTPTKGAVIKKGTTGNLTATAKLTRNNYTISYNLDGGALEEGKTNPTTYHVETTEFTLNNPSKKGHVFKGWTGTGLNEPTLTVKVTKGSTGNRSYVATYEAIGVESLTLNKKTLNITSGQNGKLIATVLPEDANNVELEWTSSDESVATVDNEGNIKTLKPGTVTITVKTTDGSNLEATCKVNVGGKVILVNIYNSSKGADIRFKPLAGAEKYTLMRKTDGIWAAVKTVKASEATKVGATQLQFIDESIKGNYGRGYIYSVSATIGNKTYDYDKTGLPLYRLRNPKLISIKSRTSTSVTVTWQAFPYSECHGYELQYSSDLGATWKKLKQVANPQVKQGDTISQVVNGLSSGTRYAFRVRCQKTNPDRGTGWSEYSPWASYLTE